MPRSLQLLAFLLSTTTPLLAQTVPISACGDTVPAGMTGVVANDITCGSGPGSFVVAVEDRGTLDLAGRTLSGGSTGVRCARRCTVTSTNGTGTIRDATTAGIAVVGERGRLKASNLSLENNTSLGVLSDFDTAVVRGKQVNLTGSGIGVQARLAQLSDFTASGNYTVLQVVIAALDGATISNSSNYGVVSIAARIRNSSITGSAGGVDIFTQRRPRVVNTTCEVSRDFNAPTVTWGVCTND
jgi:hypothetical protein